MKAGRLSIVVFSVLMLASLSCSLLGGAAAPTSTVAPSGDDNTSEPADTEISCQSASLASNSAQPGELLAVEGWPADLSTEGAYATVAGVDEELQLPLVELEEQLSLLVPIHPDGLQGGELSLTIWSDSTACNQAALQVEPITIGSTSLSGYVASLQEFMDLERTIYGVTRDELLDPEGEGLPDHLLPLAFAQQLIDGPENSNSLQAIVEGTAPVAQEADFEVALLEALIQQLALDEELQARIEARRELLAEPAANSAIHTTARIRPGLIVDISTARDLDLAMSAQAQCESADDSATGKLITDAVDSIRNAANGLIRFMPAPLKYGGKAIIKSTQLPGLSCQYLLPSELSSMTATGTILWFPDEWEGTPGAVTRTTVMGLSKQLDFEREVLDLTRDMEDEDRKQEIRQLAEDLCSAFDGCEPGEAVLGPIEYGPVDITGPGWTEAESVNSVVSVGQSGGMFIYDPEVIGTGGVQLRTREQYFGNATPANTVLEVRVDDCVDTGVNPPEGSYQFDLPDMQMACIAQGGTQPVTAFGGIYGASLAWADAYACKLRINAGPASFQVGRVLALDTASTYEGIMSRGGTTCGVTMSFDQASQSFLGELRCRLSGEGGFCMGTTGFSME